MKLLLNYPVDINHASKFGTALSLAANKGHLEIVKILLRAGADTEIVSECGGTALLGASYTHNMSIMKLLLEYKADANHGHRGRTPLHVVLQGYAMAPLPSSKLLIQYGADIRNVPRDSIQMAIRRQRKPHRRHKENPHFDCEHSSCLLSFLYAAGACITKDMYNGFKDKMPKFIIKDQKHLLTLMGLCRRQIRGYLLSTAGGNQTNLYMAVPKLPLPGKLKKYLLFDIDITVYFSPI